MNEPERVFKGAERKLLPEASRGRPTNKLYVVNQADPGLLPHRKPIPPATPPRHPFSGNHSISPPSHHLYFGLSVLNRWLSGEENPWANADFNESWRRLTVTETVWRALRDSLRKEADAWRNTVSARGQWDDLSGAAALSTIAHTAYHLGAIRQVLAAANP